MSDVFKYPPFRNHDSVKSDLEKHKQLRQAIQHRDKGSVQNILKKGAFVNDILSDVRDVQGYQSPLHLAVISRCPDIVKMLLDNGASVDCKDWNYETPLMMAAKMQNTEVTDLLLTAELDNYEDFHGFSYLDIACMRGKVDVVRSLLLKSRGENLNSAIRKDYMYWTGFTPLHFAVHFEQIEVVELLLEYGADITVKDTRQLTPLHLANLQRNETIIDLLLAAHKHTFANPINADGLSHFHIACTRDDVSVVKHFLNFGIDVNAGNKIGWKPIHFAMYYECANVVDLLSETKILMNVNILSTMFEESIFRRSFILQKPVIQKLYKVAITESGDTHVQLGRFTDFHIACIQNQSNRVKQFLSSGTISAPSDLNKPIINGCTILHLTVKSKSDKTASILLDHGADFMLQDKDGKTAFHIAFELNLHFLSYLMVKKFDEQTPNLVDHRGLSVFHILCTCDYIDEIEDFIEQGVDINLQVGNKSTYWAGWAPIHFAINCGQQEVIDVLLEHGADSTVTTELGLNSLDLALDCVNTKKGPSRGVYDRIVDDFLSTDYTGLESSGNRWSLPLHLECSSYNDDPNDLRELLTTHKDHVNKIFKSAVPNKFNGKTPLELALAHGHMQQAKLLIENGADLFRIDDYGGTPLECAFQCEYIRDNESIEAAESIFSIAIESMDKFKPSYFYVACILGLPNAVKNILAKINNQQLKFEYVNCRNDADQTPLHSLLPRREINKIAKEQIVELLLVNGADVNARDYMLQTPLHYTKKAEDLGVMRILLNHGADPNAQNMLGETPLHKMYLDFFERFDQHFNDHASFYKQIVLLLEAGSDVNMIDLQNRTCFTILTKSWLVENTEVVNELSRILLEHVKRLQVIGFCVCEKNEQAYIDLSKKIVSYNEDEFVKKCEEELQSMMSVKIDHRTTLRDILFRSLNDMAYYCENVTLSEVVSSADFARFSIYG